MKIVQSIVVITLAAWLCCGCQRELFFDGISTGYLKKDAAGNCQPITANGVYTIDSVLNQFNYVEVQAEVVMPGTYTITSDTVNGYSFAGSGKVIKGANTIRLYGTGKPVAAGVNSFTVTYGSSVCSFKVTVANTPLAEFSLAGAPNECKGVYVNGQYYKDTALTAANQITLLADVSRPGKYTVTATTGNGFQFTVNGTFTSTGIQNITLTGTGIPVSAETTKVSVSNVVSNCGINITVLAGGDTKAIFSFDGTPGECINPVVNGIYYSGIATTTVHTVIMNVFVSRVGTFSIHTNPANGLSFNAQGLFNTLGAQTVTLQAAGVPTRTGATAFIPNTGTQSCNYYVDVLPLPPPAVFTLSGSPASCAPVTVNGFYIVSKPLDAANTVVIQVNVTTAGSYSITSNTDNGISFSASGVFSTTGLQNVVLRGSGTPQATGVTSLSPFYGASYCNFNITVI